VSSTSRSSERSTGRTILAVILGIIAVLFIVAAILYLAEPANSLTILPGHIAGSTGHHPLRATGCFVVGVVFAAGAWFALAYRPKPQAASQSDKESSPAGRSAATTDSPDSD
jgi:membrane protein DedA with SNARE-associated domain